MLSNRVKIIIFRITLVLIFLGGFHRCANIMAPQGGPYDTLPPKVVSMRPEYGTTNFTEKRIYVEFDEYVKLTDLQKEFYTSPFMKRKPTVTIKGRGIQIDIQDTLPENTTYSLNFGTSLQDNNEGNPLIGFKYLFSTGDEIDSLLMSGYTVDAYSGDSISSAFILFYAAHKDSVPDHDSTVLIKSPDAVGRAMSNGIFIAENLKPIDYRVYAMQDNNSNQTYEPGVDRIGFLDSVYNPSRMPSFNVWMDTVRQYLVADPQLYMRLFMDDPFQRQFLSGTERPEQHMLLLKFASPYPQIDNLEFFNIDTTGIIREYLRDTRDSIAFWLNLPSENLPDTIKGEITYLKHDSINNLLPITENLNFAWRAIETRQQERDRLRKEKERQEAIEKGEELPPEPNPFRIKVEGGNPVNPEKNISFLFEYPLIEVDSSRISLMRKGDNDQMFRVRSRFERDTMNLRRWVLSATWQPGGEYEMIIPEGVFRDILGQTNDTLRSNFSVMDPDKYATLIINVSGKTPDSEYIIQLLSGNNNNILNEIKHAVTGQYFFNYIDPGPVRIRVVEDDNRNGIWDKGNLIQRIQSERVELFYPLPGEDQIQTKMNWEMEFTLHMNEIFGPIDMEQIRERLRRVEQARLKKMMENVKQYQSFGSPVEPQENQGLLPNFYIDD